MRQTELVEAGEEGAEIQAEEFEVLEDITAGDIVVVDPGEQTERTERTERRARSRSVATEVLEERAPRAKPARPPRPQQPRARAAGGTKRVVVLPGRKRYHAP